MTDVTVETPPGSLGVYHDQQYACATRMQWLERFGGYLALAFLVFMWPVVGAYQTGPLAPDRVRRVRGRHAPGR